jgi:long-chain acyl-CoA synthetase
MTDRIDVAGTFRGKHLLVSGATGFVGKAFLAWMIVHHPDVRRITCLIRPKARQRPIERLHGVIASAPLQIARDRLGDGLDAFVAERLDAVAGDLGKPLMGLAAADIERFTGDVDVLVNVAAQVDFTPPLNDALTTNVDGALGALELARTLGVPFCHVSTCYVAGYQSGYVAEEIRPGCPNAEISGFDAEKEVEIARRLVERIMEDRDDPTLPPPRRRLRSEGEARSRALGWPNTYTYTKSLAEKLIAKRAGDVPFSIVRPAIVESAWKFPLPGWSEGGNGSAACLLLGILGQRWTPTRDDLRLDLVPVDLVAKGLALSVAALLNRVHRPVVQLGTSDLNTLTMGRMTEIVNVWRHKRAEEADRPLYERLWLANTDAVTSPAMYENASVPAIRKLAGSLASWLDKAPVPPGGRLDKTLKRAKANVEAVERTARGVEAIYDVYRPFAFDVDIQYKTRNILAYTAMLSPEELAIYAYDPDAMDWYEYFHEVHLPGLEEWIFPEMIRKLKQGLKADTATPAPIHGDLLDLLEKSVSDHRERTFLARVGEGRPAQWTYAATWEAARRVGRRLAAEGVVPGDRVMLLIERGVEWPIAFFGTLYAGATAVPVDPASMPDSLVRMLDRSQSKAIIASRTLASKLPAGRSWLRAEDVIRESSAAEADPAPFERKPERPASILFTSGTTGVPRGVVLTHGNFLAVLRGVSGVYDELDANDRFLSLLPLHHSFEFTAGLLFPLSRGASVTYPAKVTAESLPVTLDEVRPTAIVGVPALWSLLGKRITRKIDDLPKPVRSLYRVLEKRHEELRDRLGMNVGGLLFAPVHAGLGGELRHLVSGGAALPEEVLRDFYRWGFELTSGYGLTEAAPVLTVAPPGTKRGDTVGPPIVGVDVKIVDAGADGVGEIVARGANVMAGYLDDVESTNAAIKGGWLHTGDLGRIDKDGNLVVVGRKKEVIVSASGENVYPDELEDRLQKLAGVEELAVVGLPDGQGGEKVALVVIPADGAVEASVRKAIGERIADLPGAWRPQEIRFRSQKLPRTATMKVSRAALRLECAAAPPPAVEADSEPMSIPDTGRWLVDAMAKAGNKPAIEVEASTRLGEELLLDSLAWMDLATTIERKTGQPAPIEELAAMATVGEVVEAVVGRGRRVVAKVPLFYGPDGRPLEAKTGGPIPRLPDGVREQASTLARRLHAGISGLAFDVEVTGQAHIPDDRPVLVVANHSSHVDSGVIRHALGKLGDDLPLLAAQDYFFGNAWKDLVFGDLLDLVPADRHSTGIAGVRQAMRILESGRSLAIFPEGTRSRDGEVAEFKPGAVLIALQAGVDVLLVHVEGTHQILPAGASLPRGRRVRVRIGRPIPHAWIASRIREDGASLQDVADLLHAGVLCLAAGGDTLEPWGKAVAAIGGEVS